MKMDLSVAASFERDLAEVALRDPALAGSSLAAAGLALARELDNGRNSATSKSMCARALVDVLRELRELAPEKREENPLDQIRARRDAKIARAAEAAR